MYNNSSRGLFDLYRSTDLCCIPGRSPEALQSSTYTVSPSGDAPLWMTDTWTSFKCRLTLLTHEPKHWKLVCHSLKVFSYLVFSFSVALVTAISGLKTSTTTGWVAMKCCKDMHSYGEDESCCWPSWSPHFFSEATTKVTFVVSSEICWEILDGLPWNLVQTFVLPWVWIAIILVMTL